MEPQIKQLRQLIESSSRILVTSHISPDPDALTSVLLAGTTLATNLPDKAIKMVMEEEPSNDFSFLSGYSEIKFQLLHEAVKEFKPDLLIMLDAMNFERCSRSEGESVRSAIKELGTKVVIIDHHEKVDIEPSSAYFNKGNPATVQELYEVLFDELGLKKPEGYAQTTLLGIISDTARHKYDNPRHRETFRIVSELIDAGASIEKLENRIERYDARQLKAISATIANIRDSGRGYTYAYIDEGIFGGSMSEEDKNASLKAAVEIFTSHFARNFEDNHWGFIVYPDLASGPGNYGASFRSVSGGVDVAALAHKLGGGGHKQAAGAKRIQASDVKSAVKFVQSVIAESK